MEKWEKDLIDFGCHMCRWQFEIQTRTDNNCAYRARQNILP